MILRHRRPSSWTCVGAVEGECHTHVIEPGGMVIDLQGMLECMSPWSASVWHARAWALRRCKVCGRELVSLVLGLMSISSRRHRHPCPLGQDWGAVPTSDGRRRHVLSIPLAASHGRRHRTCRGPPCGLRANRRGGTELAGQGAAGTIRHMRNPRVIYPSA